MLHSWYRYLEERAGAELMYFARGGFWLTVAQGVSVIAGLAVSIAFANLLPKETFGVYRFVLSVAAIFAATGFSGLNTALTRAVAQGNYGLYLPVFRERTKWGTLGGLAVLLLAAFYAFAGDPMLALSLAVAALFIPFSDALNVYEAYRNGLKDFKYGALAEIVIRILGAATMILALLVFKSVALLVIVYFSVYALLRLVFFIDTLRHSRHKEPAVRDVSETLAYGRHLSFIYLMGAVAAQIDKVVVFYVAGPSSLAAYALASVVPDQLRSWIKSVAVLAYPKFVTQKLPAVLGSMTRKNALLGLGALGIVVAYFFVAPYIYRLVFPAYHESILITQVLALALVDVLTLLPLSALKAHAKTTLLYTYNIVVGLLQVALIVAGGIFYGLWGVIMAMVVSRIIAIVFLFVLLRKADV